MARRAWGKLMYRAAVLVRGESSVFSHLTRMRDLEFADPERVAEAQKGALATLLRERVPQIPFYRDYGEVARGGSRADAADRLKSLPVLTKSELQDRDEALQIRDWSGRAYSKTTGGSTGQPVTVLKNPDALAKEMAASWLGYGWFGVEIGDPSVRFWGQPAKNLKRRLRYHAADLAMNRVTLSAFGYTRSKLDAYLETIRRHKARFLYGYVSVLEDLARHVIVTNASLADTPLKSVVSTAEVLSPPQRSLLEEAFGVAVQNEYGCGEVGPIAYECPDGSLHLMSTNHYIELLDEVGEPVPYGEPGAVVITDLTNEVMPLIRYRVGDTASFGGTCPCGRSFPTLANVFGREYDFVESPDGRRYHGEFFMYLFEDLRVEYPSIGQFKVVQETPDQLEVRLVLDGPAPSEELQAVADEFRRRLPAFSVDVRRVGAIQRQASGKMRVVENRAFSR